MANVIWITGASSGIGKELSIQYNRKGYRCIITARNTSALEAIKKTCAFPDNMKLLPFDIRQIDEAEGIANKAIGAWGHVDILINNAGISQRSLIVETDLQVYKKLIDVNYLGTVALTKAVLPHFIQEKRGHFVVVSSLMGKFASPYRSGYCGAKHALHGFFDALRMEHDQDNIKVTLVCPGFVQTNVAKNALTHDGSRQEVDDVATKNGLTTNVFCKKMMKAIAQERYEVYIAKGEKKGVFVKRFFPKLLHKLVLRSQVR